MEIESHLLLLSTLGFHEQTLPSNWQSFVSKSVFSTVGYLTASSWPPLKLCIYWRDGEPTSNVILEFVSCSFKKGSFLDSFSFIRDALTCTDIFQCKSCENFSAETNLDRNFNKGDVKDDDSDDDCEDKTY